MLMKEELSTSIYWENWAIYSQKNFLPSSTLPESFVIDIKVLEPHLNPPVKGQDRVTATRGGHLEVARPAR